MGEVRVKVKITNVSDATLAIEGKLKPGKVRAYETEAMVDTGAVRSVIPLQVLRKLGLPTFGRQVVEYADGRKEAVDLAKGVGFEIMDRDTSDDALVLGDEVLIGQTVLEKMDLLVDCANHRVMPNRTFATRSKIQEFFEVLVVDFLVNRKIFP